MKSLYESFVAHEICERDLVKIARRERDEAILRASLQGLSMPKGLTQEDIEQHNRKMGQIAKELE